MSKKWIIFLVSKWVLSHKKTWMEFVCRIELWKGYKCFHQTPKPPIFPIWQNRFDSFLCYYLCVVAPWREFLSLYCHNSFFSVRMTSLTWCFSVLYYFCKCFIRFTKNVAETYPRITLTYPAISANVASILILSIWWSHLQFKNLGWHLMTHWKTSPWVGPFSKAALWAPVLTSDRWPGPPSWCFLQPGCAEDQRSSWPASLGWWRRSERGTCCLWFC